MNFPSFGEFHDARVGAFAVGDEDVAVLGYGEVGHAVEGIVRGVVAGDVLLAKRQDQLSVGVEFERLHMAAVGDPDVAETIDTQKMGELEHALAPCAEEFSVAVEDHDGHRFVALKDVDVVVRVDVHAGCADPAGYAGWELRPIFDELIFALRGAHGCCFVSDDCAECDDGCGGG